MTIQQLKTIAAEHQKVRRKQLIDTILFDAYTRIWLHGAYGDLLPGQITVAGGIQFRLPVWYQQQPGFVLFDMPYDHATLTFNIGGEDHNFRLTFDNGKPSPPEPRSVGEYFIALDKAINPP